MGPMNVDVALQRLAKDPHNPLFRFSAGQALFAAERYGDALEHLRFCVESRADWMLPRILLGKALIALGQPAEAKPVLEQALELALVQHHEDPEAEVREILATLP